MIVSGESFNILLTNNYDSFEQLGPGIYILRKVGIGTMQACPGQRNSHFVVRSRNCTDTIVELCKGLFCNCYRIGLCFYAKWETFWKKWESLPSRALSEEEYWWKSSKMITGGYNVWEFPKCLLFEVSNQCCFFIMQIQFIDQIAIKKRKTAVVYKSSG